MNSSAGTTVGLWNIPQLATRCSQDWEILRCPLVSMFAFVRSAARLFLIGSAGAVLGLAGFILSILAYIKEAMGVTRPRRLSTDVFAASESTSLPRDRDRRTRKPSMPQTRHDRPKQLSGRPRSAKSPRAHLSESGPRSTVRTLSSSSLDPKEPEQERLGRPRRRRTQGSTQEMSSVEDVIVTSSPHSAPTTVIHEVTAGVTAGVSLPRRPRRSLSNLSSTQSSEISMRRLSLEEHLPLSGRRVLMKIKDSRSQLRERCLTRVQSLPPHRPSVRPPRTDPYQAPYFFPSPMSPEAATYIQEIVNERQGTQPASVTIPAAVESYSTNAILPENTTRLTLPPSPPSPPVEKTDASASAKHQRWSLHLPHFPHHHRANNGVRLVDGQVEEKGGTAVRKELFARLKLGHHRRRHGIGSADSHMTVSSMAS